MIKNQPTRPLEEGVDPSNERMVLDHLLILDKDKKTPALRSEEKKRVRSQATPRR